MSVWRSWNFINHSEEGGSNSEKEFQMKTRMFLSLLLLAAVVPGALAAADEVETKARSRRDSLLVSPAEDSAVTSVQSAAIHKAINTMNAQ